MKRVHFSIAGAILFLVGGKIYNYCQTAPLCQQTNGFAFDYAWFLWGGVILLVIGVLLDCLPHGMIATPLPKSKWPSRAEGEKYLRQVEKDMSQRHGKPNKPTRAEIQEEREAYNREESAACFYGGFTDYKDYDGNWKEI